MSSACYCNSQLAYQDCCQPKHRDPATADTPEALMRSRFSAFCRRDSEYLIATHKHLQVPSAEELQQVFEHTQWLGLEIVSSAQDSDSTGWVEFKAWFKDSDSGKVDAIWEVSQFVRHNQQWYYTQGQQRKVNLPSRNEPCVCFSGKKFKKCCGA